MSNPSFSNIDMWLFELAEGNLSPDQMAKLELFLLQNPELDVDRDVWEMAKVSAAPVAYPDQAGLSKRKPIGAYTLIGSSALLLFTLVGCLSYFTVTTPEMPVHTAEVTTADLQEENKDLRQEIDDLKAIVTSLEGEISSSRGSNLTTENEPIDLTSDPVTVSGTVGSTPSGLASGGTLTGASSLAGAPSASIGAGGVLAGSGLAEPGTHSASSTSAMALSGLVAPGNGSGALVAATPGILSAEPFELVAFREAESMPTSVDYESSTSEPRKSSDWTNTYHVDYHISMKNRMSRWSKRVQRMMDNPVALKNSRDPHYHVPGKLSQDINFGSTGTLIAPRVQTLSRLQWHGESNELMTNQLAVDGYSYAMRGGIGIQLNHSYYNNGGLQVSNAAFTYSPKISVSRTILIEPAFRFKMGNKLLNDSYMGDASLVEIDRGIVHNYYSDGSQPVGRSLWYKDFGLGLNVNTKWFFASAQLDNIFNHRDNIYTTDLTDPRRAGTHFVTTIGTDYESKKKDAKQMPVLGLSTYLMYQKNEQLSEGWFGMNARWRWLTVGAAVSSNLDPAASIGIKLKHFSFTYNADYAYSVMNNKNSLSHQVTLRFLGKPSPFGKRLLNL